MTLLIELSNKLKHLTEKEQIVHLKTILAYLLPYGNDSFFGLDHLRVPAIGIMRKYFKEKFDLELCNYTTKSSLRRIIDTDTAATVHQVSGGDTYQSKYGTVYSFKEFDKYRYDFDFESNELIYRYQHICNNFKNDPEIARIAKANERVLHLPYPPRICVMNKNNLMGNSLNAQLIAQINKLKQNCNDFEKLESIKEQQTTRYSSANAWFNIQSRRAINIVKNINSTIVKQHIIDPLLNTSKYFIPSLFYVDKDKHTCQILTEINNCPRLYNLHLYDLIGLIFYKFIATIEYMLNLNDLNHQTIQVIVSCHNKIIQPKTHYVGNLHREGFIDGESIQIGCIYYFDKSKCLNDENGDILQIVSSQSPEIHSLHYASYTHEYESFNLNISKNDCIVFNNTLMNHQVFKLCNKSSNETGHRSLISFWLPKYKINSSHEIDVSYQYKHYKYHFLRVFDIVKNWVRKFNQQRTQMIICKDVENVMNRYIVSEQILQYSKNRGSGNNKCSTLDMNQLNETRDKLRNERTDRKMRNEAEPICIE